MGGERLDSFHQALSCCILEDLLDDVAPGTVCVPFHPEHLQAQVEPQQDFLFLPESPLADREVGSTAPELPLAELELPPAELELPPAWPELPPAGPELPPANGIGPVELLEGCIVVSGCISLCEEVDGRCGHESGFSMSYDCCAMVSKSG